MFNSLEIDDIKLEEMMSKTKSKELGDLLGSVLEQYKFELQGKKYYKFLTNEIKMKNVFGSLSCFDYDIDNIKVNIVQSTFKPKLSFFWLFVPFS